MPDINLRFDRDMIVLSAPIESVVTSTGVARKDFELALLVEPDTIEEAYRRALVAGATCLVTPTGHLTRARLARHRLEERAADLVRAAFVPIAMLRNEGLVPQHVLAEIGPCGLPLDVASAASLREHRQQYAELVKHFDGFAFDGFLLDGFNRLGALEPAVEALQAVYDGLIFIEANVDGRGMLSGGFENLEDLAAFADRWNCAVVGMRVADVNVASHMTALVRELASMTTKPLLVSLVIEESLKADDTDDLVLQAELLRDAGAQFLRVVGSAATALETAALAGAVGGMPVVKRPEESEIPASDESVESEVGEEIPFKPIPDDLIARFSARVDEALGC